MPASAPLDNKAYMPYPEGVAHILKFYEEPNGQCQVRDYLRANNKAVRGEAGWLLTRLQEEGDSLERPLSGYLEDGIYELRIIVERNQHRILYFFHKSTIIATNAFIKKSHRVPKGEIGKAKEARADWLKRAQERKQ